MASCVRPEQGRLGAVHREFEPRLMAAHQLDIDGGEQPAIEQRAMLLALRQIDAVALAQRIEAARRAGMPPPRQRQRVDHAVPAQQRPRQPVELGIEEAEIEGGVVHHQHGAFDEGQHVVGQLAEARLVAQELGGQAVHLEGLIGHLALGVEVAVPHPARRDAVEELDAADLDDSVAVERVEPGGLGVEHDLAQVCCLASGRRNRSITRPSFVLSDSISLSISSCMSWRLKPLSTT